MVIVEEGEDISSNGDRSSTRSGGKKNASPTPPLLPGRNELDRLLEDAEYELSQDPYRGLQIAVESNGQTTSPWQACCWNVLPEDEWNDFIDENDSAEAFKLLTTSSEASVQYLCRCNCPSLVAWTEQLQSSLKKSKSKKRKAGSSKIEGDKVAAIGLGQRESDDSSDASKPRRIYKCDFNPFCLASLGGVMNDILRERSEEAQRQIRALSIPASSAVLEKSDEEEGNDDDPGLTDDKEGKRPRVINLTGGDQTDDVSAIVDATDSRQKDDDSNEDMEFTGNEAKLWDAKAKERQKESTSTSSDKAMVIRIPPAIPFEASKAISSPSNAINHVFTREITTAEEEYRRSMFEYNKFTKESLEELRKDLKLDVEPIKEYISSRVEKFIADGRGNSVKTPQDFLELIRKWHKSTMFEEPPQNRRAEEASREEILLSVPPGISNLGATCYLNTQLQCLAQNTTFLDGIFSWKHQKGGEDRMNSVMSSLQTLLAEMLLGGGNKVSTSDFSNALGLDFGEQQDPNEFARLLFDRMDESFNSSGDPELSNLLQKIFRGEVTYETRCNACSTISSRKEAFMDINLPIVQPANDEVAPVKGQTTLEQAFASNKNVDTDLQYCLKTYLSPEKLDGDNQYFCGACDCKRDAERALKITSLPPVLNVQLSRYVFDRKKFVKKKLSDKVLLPSVLKLSGKEFLLCAVMRHQGKSAYSGHYVAEAMDWSTGLWYEFNDEQVKQLKSGPSCSFDPEDGDPKRGVTGSTDAYNMYYVEEAYLADKALNSILQRNDFRNQSPSPSSESGSRSTNVLVRVADARERKYSLVSEMCMRDLRMSDRMFRRRSGIRKYMFPNATVLSHLISFDSSMDQHNGPVWVLAEPLRKFLACDDSLDGILQGSGPVLRHKELLCEHNALHPRMARKGKLLPRSVYDAYVTLLQRERAMMTGCGNGVSARDTEDINDIVITPGQNIFCECCAETYKNELKRKVEVIGLLKELYIDLDPKVKDIKMTNVEEHELRLHDFQYGYALHKPFATRLRKIVMAIGKSVINVNSGSVESFPLGVLGVDGIDLSIVDAALAPCVASPELISVVSESKLVLAGRNKGTTSQTNSKNEEAVDKTVNSAITCRHGNTNDLGNKKTSTRLVPFPVWSKIKRLFPEAIEHRRLRVGFDDLGESNDLNFKCQQCGHDADLMGNFLAALHSWAFKVKHDQNLKLLVESKDSISKEDLVHNFTKGNQGCKLVDEADIQTWRHLVKEALKTSSAALTEKTKTISDLKENIQRIAFPNHHKVVLEFESSQPAEKLLASLRSLICQQHHRCIMGAMFQQRSKEDTENRMLSNNVAVIPDEQYFKFVESLASLLDLLDSCEFGTEKSPLEVDVDDGTSIPSSSLQTLLKTLTRYHPSIRLKEEDDDEEDVHMNDPSTFSLKNSDKWFVISPDACECKSCHLEFFQERAAEESEKTTKGRKGIKLPGSAADEPILVESDVEDELPKSFELRVFELDRTAVMADAVKSLREASALPPDPIQSPPGTLDNFIRRSTRKKATRYPCGKLLSGTVVKVAPHHNIAALRLILFERCEVGVDDNKLFLLLSDSSERGDVKHVELTGDSIAKQLSDFVDELGSDLPNSSSNEEDADQSNPFSSVVLLYQNDSAINVDKANTDTMHHLLEISNIDPGKSKNNGKGGKNRPAERGFSGTLLGSSRPTALSSEGSVRDDDSLPAKNSRESSEPSEVVEEVEIVEEENGSPPKNDRSHSPIVDVSDDESVVLSPATTERKRKRCISDAVEQDESKPTIVDEIDSPEVSVDTGKSSDDELIQRIAEALVEFFGTSTGDEMECWEAAKWALENSTNEYDFDVLRDSAVNYMLEEKTKENKK